MNDDRKNNLIRLGDRKPKQHGRKLQKLKLRSTLEEQVEQLEAQNRVQFDKLCSMGAVLHALVLRHGKQVFDRQELNDKCTIRGVEFGTVGSDRVVLQLTADPEDVEDA
jgi:hypothetical protein